MVRSDIDATVVILSDWRDTGDGLSENTKTSSTYTSTPQFKEASIMSTSTEH